NAVQMLADRKACRRANPIFERGRYSVNSLNPRPIATPRCGARFPSSTPLCKAQRLQPHLIDRRPRRQLAAIDSLGPQVASDPGRLDETFATLCPRNGRPIIPPFLAVTRRPAHQ